MPVVRIENAGDLTREQKQKLIADMTDVIENVTGKARSSVYVKIEEVPRENFGVAGKPLG